MDIQHPEELWLISVFEEFGQYEEWNRLRMATVNLSVNAKVSIPNFQIGGLNALKDLEVLWFNVESVLACLAKFASKLGEERCNLWENFLAYNDYNDGYITNFIWNVVKYSPIKTASQICHIFDEEINQTWSHFLNNWGSYDHSRRVAIAKILRSERERDLENTSQQRPRRRRLYVGIHTHDMSLLVRWIQQTFRKMFDLFLHIIALKIYVETVQVYRMSEFAIFLITPIQKLRTETVLDNFFWEYHRTHPYPSMFLPLQQVTDENRSLNRPYPFFRVKLDFMQHPRFMVQPLCPSLYE